MNKYSSDSNQVMVSRGYYKSMLWTTIITNQIPNLLNQTPGFYHLNQCILHLSSDFTPLTNENKADHIQIQLRIVHSISKPYAHSSLSNEEFTIQKGFVHGHNGGRLAQITPQLNDHQHPKLNLTVSHHCMRISMYFFHSKL